MAASIAGALTVTAALSVAVYAIVTANQHGWGSGTTVVLLVGAAALLALFVLIEQRRKEPLVPLRIFRTPNLAAANLAMALLGASWIPLWFFLNLYLQKVLGFGAFKSGAALLPMTLAILLLMVGVTGRLIPRLGFKPLAVAGLVVLGAGIALFARVPAGGGYAADVLGASLVAALGMSLAYIPVLVASLSGAKPEEAGLASGLINTSYQVGSALGIAVIGTLVTTQTVAHAVRRVNTSHTLPRTVRAQAAGQIRAASTGYRPAPGTPQRAIDELGRIMTGAVGSGTRDALLFAAAVVLLGLFVSMLLPKSPRHADTDLDEPPDRRPEPLSAELADELADYVPIDLDGDRPRPPIPVALPRVPASGAVEAASDPS